MKYITLLLIIGMGLISSTAQLNAQRDGQRDVQRDGSKKEKIEQLKIAFITQKMALSIEDAQRFWPIYNKYQGQLSALKEQRKERVEDRVKGERGDRGLDVASMTEAEAKTTYNQYLDREQQKLAITQQMISELEGSFSAKQILSYLDAEKRFKRQILTNVKEKMKKNRDQKQR